jgi:hypothetical protein
VQMAKKPYSKRRLRLLQVAADGDQRLYLGACDGGKMGARNGRSFWTTSDRARPSKFAGLRRLSYGRLPERTFVAGACLPFMASIWRHAQEEVEASESPAQAPLNERPKRAIGFNLLTCSHLGMSKLYRVHPSRKTANESGAQSHGCLNQHSKRIGICCRNS